MSDDDPAAQCLGLTADIVAAHVGNHDVPADALPGLIRSVYRTLLTLAGAVRPPGSTGKPKPAVPVKRSVFPAYIICLEDGKKLTLLKRHLREVYGLTPQQYRERWGLPADYPMVAPDYAARRSQHARDIGLGHVGRTPVGEKQAPPDIGDTAATPVVHVIPEGKSGRPRGGKAAAKQAPGG